MLKNHNFFKIGIEFNKIMYFLKKLKQKQSFKSDKQTNILLGAIELYIKTKKPIGSNTLKENGFDNFSSATIRNYFAKLEKLGFLKQKHSSSGRVPTSLGYRAYANFCFENFKITEKREKEIKKHILKPSKKLNEYLQKSAEKLSEICDSAVFLLFPHLDHDFIQDIKLLFLNKKAILCVIITNFGMIKTETFFLEKDLEEKYLKILEKFFCWKIGKEENPKIPNFLKPLAQKMYNEIMLRYVTRYYNTLKEEKYYKAGLSNLLSHKEFQDPTVLINCLTLFENSEKIISLLQESIKINRLTFWIGQELANFGSLATDCSVIAIPYLINHIPVGAFGVIAPKIINYTKFFEILSIFSRYISKNLEYSVYKYKIQFKKDTNFQETFILLEDKSKG